MYIAGVDEVGRGCIAGKVVAAAVILDAAIPPIEGLTDSKKLSARKREMLDTQIKEQALAWSIASASIAEIDEINILSASLLAMQRAVEQLSITPALVRVDGNQAPTVNYPVENIIGGDSSEACISAASIIAKVYRDNYMCELDAQYPGYDFATNKGYPTKKHLLALDKIGVSNVHRKSFKPVYARLHVAN